MIRVDPELNLLIVRSPPAHHREHIDVSQDVQAVEVHPEHTTTRGVELHLHELHSARECVSHSRAPVQENENTGHAVGSCVLTLSVRTKVQPLPLWPTLNGIGSEYHSSSPMAKRSVCAPKTQARRRELSSEGASCPAREKRAR